MQQLATVDDFIALKNQIRLLNKRIVVDTPSRFWASDFKRDALALCEKNNAIYQELPESFDIKPELAAFMIKNLTTLNQGQKILAESNRGWLHSFTVVASSVHALIAPSQHTVSDAIRSWKRFFQSAADQGAKETEFYKLLDIPTLVILGAYKLTEIEPGKFTLTRGSWKTVKETVSMERYTFDHWFMKPQGTSLACVSSEMGYFFEAACGYNGMAEINLTPKPQKNR